MQSLQPFVSKKREIKINKFEKYFYKQDLLPLNSIQGEVAAELGV